jgi:hypothetical protein
VYKDLVAVRRNKSTQQAEVTSQVFKLTGTTLFPTPSPRHTCIAAVDAAKRLVTFFYSAFVTFW